MTMKKLLLPDIWANILALIEIQVQDQRVKVQEEFM